MRDVVFGFVHDFGSGEEWTATRGGGAWLNGERLGAVRPKDEIEILALEATVAAAVADKAEAFAGFARRLRIMGSLALSLCNLAAGRVDAVCSLKEARAVDIAAAQLLAARGRACRSCSWTQRRSTPGRSTPSRARRWPPPARRSSASGSRTSSPPDGTDQLKERL